MSVTISTLGKIGNPEAIPLLIEIYEKNVFGTAASAIRSIGWIGSTAGLDVLQRARHTAKPSVRKAARGAISTIHAGNDQVARRYRRMNLSGTDADELAYLGYTSLKNRNPERAIQLLRRVVEMKSESHREWYNLGVAYCRSRCYDDAVAAFERAFELAPSDDTYRTALDQLRANVD